MRDHELTLPYGERRLTFRVPRVHTVELLLPREVPPAKDPLATLARALDAPLDAPPLGELARDKRSATIVVDDLTRLTPVRFILPLLLERLAQGGLRAEQVKVLMALGTHRAMTEGELRDRVGEEVWGQVPVLNHAHWDPAELVDLGPTRSGTPIHLNHHVVEADLVIGVGSVFPHHIAGYSGGSKIIQPGVSGAATTGATHFASARTRRSYLGILRNPIREEMDAVAEAAGMPVCLNCVLTRHGDLVRAFYGTPRKVLAVAAAEADAIYGVPFQEQADVVVAGSYPADIEFWQAHKTLYPADLVVREGGIIVVVTPCPEGLAVTHPEMVELAGLSSQDLIRRVEAGKVEDLVGAGLALAWAQVKERAQVWIVSDGISDEVARAVRFVPFSSVQEAVDAALRQVGPEARVAAIPYAPECLPLHRPA